MPRIPPYAYYVFSVLLLLSWGIWVFVFRANANHEKLVLKIHPNTEFAVLMREMQSDSVFKQPRTFLILTKILGYSNKIKPGLYRIESGMNNRDILQLLVSGRQMEVNLVLRSGWGKAGLSSFIAKELCVDSAHFHQLLSDSVFLGEFGWNPETVLAAFIPNTYRVYWTTSAKSLLRRMFKEYNRFWNELRVKKAKEMNLTPLEISILASIVEKETFLIEEMPTVAGVYLNRLRKGMRLEADPTVIFAAGDPSIKRVSGEMLRSKSPYNTYRVVGLPPGPICIPSIQAIEAVLKNEQHNYFYFCAKEDFSGYHRFTNSYQKHLINARKYRKELTKRGIN